MLISTLFQWGNTTGPICAVDQGPVVQSIVSLTMSFRCQFVLYMLTILSNPLLFFVEKMQDSYIFPTKNNSGFVIFTF